MFVLLTFVAKILSKQTNNNIYIFNDPISSNNYNILSSQSDLYQDQFISVKIIWLD